MNLTKIMPSDILKEYTDVLIQSLSTLEENTFHQIKQFEIDCANWPTVEEGYQTSKHLNDLIEALHYNNNEQPAVYWIEIISDHTASDIHTPYGDFKNGNKGILTLPAYKKKIKRWDSKVLYVGKAKFNMAGRMILHLGYGNRSNLQGLNLCHWKHIEGLKLRLNVIPLPKNLDVIAPVFELKLANELNPILGFHR